MAINWSYNENDYVAQEYSVIPAGDHRVRIEDVVEKTFKSGNVGFEVTFAVSGHNSRLWHYIVLDHSDPKKTNQRLGTFFECFGIADTNVAHYRGWIGKVGGVRVKHEDYNGNTSAKVAFCLSRKNQEKLPAANFGGAAPTAPAAGYAAMPTFNESDLPFN